MVLVDIALGIVLIAIVDVFFCQREDGLHTACCQILRTHANQAGNALGAVVLAGFTGVLLSDGTGVAGQVKLDTFIMKGPAGGPQSSVTGVVQVVANLPWVLDCAAQRCNHSQAEQNAGSAQQPLNGLTATKGGSLPRIIQQRGQGTTVNLFGRTVMATLYGNLLWEDLLNVLNNGDTQRTNCECGGNTQQRSVEGVPNVALLP